MNIIKRNGMEVPFDRQKIVTAITKANETVNEEARLKPIYIEAIAQDVEEAVMARISVVHVEDIQDMVVFALMKHAPVVAMKYEKYREKRAMIRRANTTDDKILSLINCENEEVKQENSNKNPIINSTQRDYMAGEVSRDLSDRILLPKEVVDAHKAGIIHFHDSDYFAQKEHNCDLVNLEDMLQNGTVISDTLIEKPHSFHTACNITTQIIAQVASNQYGGQSFSLAHLVPFVEVSRQKIRKHLAAEMEVTGVILNKEQQEAVVAMRLKDEITKGIQTIQYQLITLMTCNGQAPFVTMFMYLDEVPEGRQRDDLAMLIEEVLKQRYQGVKNEKGVWITPAFPKLIYVLDEDNITEDSKYWYLTKQAARCTAKRMVPDYISAKIMKEMKGAVYTCMGCRSFLTPERSYLKGNLANAGNYREGERKYYGHQPGRRCFKLWKRYGQVLENSG